MKRLLPFILLFLFCIPALLGLFHPGFFVSDDGNWMVIRLSAFYSAFRHGQFPVRFLLQLNNGYGYPVADFLYPLFLYLAVPIHLVGINFVTTVKILFALGMLLSGIGCFLWLWTIVGKGASFLGAMVYVYSPYHLYDLYHRGSLGEILALAIVPFILWQIEKKHMLVTACGIGLLLLAHNSLAVLFLPLIIMYMLIRRSFPFLKIFFLVLIGLGLAAFFWMPALFDKQYTVFDSTSVSDFTNYFLSLSSFYLFGWISLLVLVLTIPFFVMKTKLPFLFFWFVTFFSLFLALSISNSLWTTLHIVPFFQFPYRFLSVTILGVSFLTAFEIELLSKKLRIGAYILLASVTILSSYPLLFPTTYQYLPDSFYSTNQDSTTVKNEYMPIWVKVPQVSYPLHRFTILTGKGIVEDESVSGTTLTGIVSLLQTSRIQLNVVYFPGWRVLVDGKQSAISFTNRNGLIQILVPQGRHSINATFTETWYRMISDYVSLLSVLVMIILIVQRRLREKE